MLIKTHRDGFNHPTPSEITPPSVYAGRRDLMKLMATGVAGAAMASWAGREAHAQGIAIPDRLAIIGLGDQSFSRDLDPPLTSVRIDGTAIGRLAAQFIIERAEERVVLEPVRDIGFSIIERGST